MVKCVIVGCKSNSLNDSSIRFFKFPASNDPVYEKWLKICHQSEDIIRVHPEPFICSKHFPDNISTLTRLSFPSLNLNPVQLLKSAISARHRRNNLEDLINETLLEWSSRAYHFAALRCKDKCVVIKMAKEVLNLLDPTLETQFNKGWWTKFQKMQTSRLESLNLDDSWRKSLNLADIIQELDPSVNIIRKDEMVVPEEEVNVKAQKDIVSEEVLNDEVLEKSVPDEGLKDKIEKDIVTEPSVSSKEVISSVPAVKSEITMIDSYSQALEYIKALEDFVLEEEDYRAIGMLSSLKDILQSREDSQ